MCELRKWWNEACGGEHRAVKGPPTKHPSKLFIISVTLLALLEYHVKHPQHIAITLLTALEFIYIQHCQVNRCSGDFSAHTLLCQHSLSSSGSSQRPSSASRTPTPPPLSFSWLNKALRSLLPPVRLAVVGLEWDRFLKLALQGIHSPQRGLRSVKASPSLYLLP